MLKSHQDRLYLVHHAIPTDASHPNRDGSEDLLTISWYRGKSHVTRSPLKREWQGVIVWHLVIVRPLPHDIEVFAFVRCHELHKDTWSVISSNRKWTRLDLH